MIGTSLTRKKQLGDAFGIQALQIIEADVAEALRQHFLFVGRLYELVDPYHRQHALHYNTAIIGATHQRLAKEPATGGAITMSNRGDSVPAHPRPRRVGRGILSEPGSEIARTLELLRRRMNE